METLKVTSNGDIPFKFNTEETEFVKNIKKEQCEGCRAHGCGARDVLMCWLRQNFLPEGEWRKATEYDIFNKCAEDLSKEIDKEIMEELKRKYKYYGK